MLSCSSRTGAGVAGRQYQPHSAAAVLSVRAMSSGDGRARRPVARQTSINSGSFRSAPEEGDGADAEQPKVVVKKSLVGGNVHGSYNAKEHNERWKKSPLFARLGQPLLFESGSEASELLATEARRRDPYQSDFLQAVDEVAQDISPTIDRHPRYAWVFKQLMEPERLITFRVPWQDDDGNARINRGYRVQYSSALGPFHGGLRFHQSMSHGSVRMLGWEQTLKNALTGFGYGGSKGGADFDPSNKSPQEIARFCDSFMTQLSPFVGPGEDTMEGGRGVGPQEIAAFHRTLNRLGKATEHQALFGSGEVFPEASGYGSAYMASHMLADIKGTSLDGKRCGLSGSGRVAQSTALKLIEMGAKVVALSDPDGYLYEPEGFSPAQIEQVAVLRTHRRPLEKYLQSSPSAKHVSVQEGSLWTGVEMDLAFPSLIQGEINAEDAQALVNNGCIAVVENTDYACTGTAKHILKENNTVLVPSKLASAGSVMATGMLLGSQASQSLTKQDLDDFVRQSTADSLLRVRETAAEYGDPDDLQKGANIASFLAIACSPMYSPSSPMYA